MEHCRQLILFSSIESRQEPTSGLRKEKLRENNTESDEVGEVDEVDEDSARDLQLSYTIHHSSLKPKTVELRTRSPSTLREEAKEKRLSRESGRRLLMFHGIILRSQLIELLKYKAFFSEGEEVSGSSIYDISLLHCQCLYISQLLV